jgi:hypothetical protein
MYENLTNAELRRTITALKGVESRREREYAEAHSGSYAGAAVRSRAYIAYGRATARRAAAECELDRRERQIAEDVADTNKAMV